jgi:RNA polymerase sigma factor (sigma-70 family)
MPEDASDDLNDDSLVLRMMDCDEDALRLFLETHGPRIRGALRSKFRDVLADPEIDEAMNMAALKAYRNIDRFDGFKGTLRGWFYIIAVRTTQDLIRREQRHRHADLDFDPPDPGVFERTDPTSSNRTESLEVRDLNKAIETELTPSERRVVLEDLAAGDGGIADSARLAEMMGSTVASVHTLRSRARKKIQQFMLKQGHYQSTQRSKP